MIEQARNRSSVERSIEALRHISAVLADLQDASPRSFVSALAGDPHGELVDGEYLELLDLVTDQLTLCLDAEATKASGAPAKPASPTRKSIAMHELGNALGTVVLTAQLGLELAKEPERSPFGPNAFESIHRAATRMRALVAELRDDTLIEPRLPPRRRPARAIRAARIASAKEQR